MVVDSFLIFFSLSDHVTLLFLIQSSSYIKDRLRNLTSFFNFSISFFFDFRAFFLTSLLMRCLLFVYIVDVDDASEEKVVISEQQLALGVVLVCLITLIKVAICSFSFFCFCHPLDFFFSLAKTEIIVFKLFVCFLGRK